MAPGANQAANSPDGFAGVPFIPQWDDGSTNSMALGANQAANSLDGFAGAPLNPDGGSYNPYSAHISGSFSGSGAYASPNRFGGLSSNGPNSMSVGSGSASSAGAGPRGLYEPVPRGLYEPVNPHAPSGSSTNRGVGSPGPSHGGLSTYAGPSYGGRSGYGGYGGLSSRTGYPGPSTYAGPSYAGPSYGGRSSYVGPSYSGRSSRTGHVAGRSHVPYGPVGTVSRSRGPYRALDSGGLSGDPSGYGLTTGSSRSLSRPSASSRGPSYYLGLLADRSTLTMTNGKSVAALKITRVFSGSPAEKAGLKPGNLMALANDRLIRSSADLNRVIADSGGTLKLTLSDGLGHYRTVSVQLQRSH